MERRKEGNTDKYTLYSMYLLAAAQFSGALHLTDCSSWTTELAGNPTVCMRGEEEGRGAVGE